MLIGRKFVDSRGRVWLIERAVSARAALTAIGHARLFGAIGHTDVHTVDGETTTLAAVHRLNADGTRAQPA